jgi:AcrR family transcriptional regulator
MKTDARTRLLEAAVRIFSKQGWQATTREIAREAGVNEVTLFRLFGSKRELLQEVVGSLVCRNRDLLAEAERTHGTLREILEHFAAAYHVNLSKSADFIRVSLGEFVRNPAEAKAVMSGVVKPMRHQFLEILTERQKRGEIRADVNCETVLDLFIGMLFSNVIKPTLTKVSYTPEDYRKLCVEFVMRGIEP